MPEISSLQAALKRGILWRARGLIRVLAIALAGFLTPAALLSSFHYKAPLQGTKEHRVAVCLTGQAREYIITGASQKEHLLNADWEPVDLFLSTALDEDSFELSVLSGTSANIVAVRMVADGPTDERVYPEKLFDPTLFRGNAQKAYYQLETVEACVKLVRQHEKNNRFQYRWVFRTRMDSFWVKPPPKLDTLPRNVLTVPWGNNWLGVNDRLGVATSDTMALATTRLEKLRELEADGYRTINAETSLRLHLQKTHVRVWRAEFHFCILSDKLIYPPMIAMYSLTSTGSLNGAYCRPCPTLSPAESERADSTMKHSDDAYPGPPSPGRISCTAGNLPRPPGWEEELDKHTSRDAADARVRIPRLNHTECIAHLEQLRRPVATWHAPTPKGICIRRALGKMTLLGSGESTFPTLLTPLHANSIVYSIGLGASRAWDAALKDAIPGLQVALLDATTAGSRCQHVLPDGRCQEHLVLATESGFVTLQAIKRMRGGGEEKRYTLAKSVPAGFRFAKGGERGGARLAATAMTVGEIVALNRHARADVLKMDLEGYERELLQYWADENQPIQVCQLLIRFVDDASALPDYHLTREKKQLAGLGFTSFKCHREVEGGGTTCGFFSSNWC